MALCPERIEEPGSERYPDHRAPACVAGFEEIIAMGAKKFVLFGSCGVLDDDNVKDNIIIPVSAVRDEGTSYHYIAPSSEIEADPHSVQILESVLSSCGYPYVKGKTFERYLQRNATPYSRTQTRGLPCRRNGMCFHAGSC